MSSGQSHEPDALELGLPAPVTAPGLPAHVRIHEVGPRDGLQNESSLVPVEVKAEFIARLAAAGLGTVEATSFVHPKWVPQLADAEELMPRLGGLPDRHPGLRLPVLVPNERGLDRALVHGVTDIAVFASATETFARRNLNRSADEVLEMFRPVVRRAADAGVPTRSYLSMCFGDPWEGPVPAAQVIDFGVRLLELGCTELSLGDTIGVATPGQVTALLEGFDRAGVPVEQIAVHFHDTYGQALANTLAALRCGVTTVDASAGGLGGCPYAKSATGNLATEDLVWMLHGLGISTGVDLRALVATSGWMARQLGRPSPSRAVQALVGTSA
ncbi:hydroxymethylglutaryl-CoA lyase [Kitasatospora sp. McL0602]|uniref:hydroxymethylglutaryl-CoA lyase n=1 Tax=Kitasatospora sp. McL0602 TaxID=3439530 RepID=UPI003F8A2CF7